MTTATISVLVYLRGKGKAAKISIYEGVFPILNSQKQLVFPAPIVDETTNAIWYHAALLGEVYTVRVRYRYDYEGETWLYDQWQTVNAPADVKFHLDSGAPEEPPKQPPPISEPTPEIPEATPRVRIPPTTCCLLSAFTLPCLALLCYLFSML